MSGNPRSGGTDTAAQRLPRHSAKGHGQDAVPPLQSDGGKGVIIDRLRWTDPARNAPLAVPTVALSVYVFAYSTLYGPPAILLFYGVWAPFILTTDRRVWTALHRPALILALPVLALLSTLWSDRPDTTLRSAIQYSSTVVPGLVAARTVSTRSLSLGIAAGGTLVLLYSHANGSYAYDVVDGTYAFAGAFSSKNQLGLYASLTLLGAGAAVTMAGRPALAAIAAAPVLVLAAVTLWMTESATSVLTVAAALLAMGAAAALCALPPLPRLVTLVAAILVFAGAAALALQLGAFDSLLGVFGKDTTLTGRTYLWSRGIEFGTATGPAGLGYNAFWVTGRALAEELWTEFHIATFSGFHFHNTLIEGFVALGPAGLALLAGWTLGLPLLALRMVASTPHPAVQHPAIPRASGRPPIAATAFVAALSVLFAIRAFVEIDFFTPFTAGSFLVPYLLLAMGDRATAFDASARNVASDRAGRRPRGEPSGGHPAFSAGAR